MISTTALSCKLTSAELMERKTTVLKSLQKKVLRKEELENGFAFTFDGSDEIIDELSEFIKTERECCDFFTLNLIVAGDKNSCRLELTGPEGVKEFIQTELEL